MVGACVKTSELSIDSQTADDRAGEGQALQSETDSTCRSQNPALDDFKATSPMKSKMNLCSWTRRNQIQTATPSEKRISTELLSSTGNGMILLRCAGVIKFPTLFRELLK